MVIKIKNTVDKWNAPDFIKYFTKKYIRLYNKDYGVVVWGKEGILFQKIQREFFVRGKEQTEIIKFIDWGFDMYSEDKVEGTLTIGYLYKAIEKYFKIRKWEEPIIQAIQDESELDDEMKKWLEEELNR